MMTELLINNLREQAKRRSLSGYTKCLLNVAADALQDDLETRVKVVRCKDCRWLSTTYGWNGSKYNICGMFGFCGMQVNDDFYCADGKRRSE